MNRPPCNEASFILPETRFMLCSESHFSVRLGMFLRRSIAKRGDGSLMQLQ
jgi:hypothetical protein